MFLHMILEKLFLNLFFYYNKSRRIKPGGAIKWIIFPYLS